MDNTDLAIQLDHFKIEVAKISGPTRLVVVQTPNGNIDCFGIDGGSGTGPVVILTIPRA